MKKRIISLLSAILFTAASVLPAAAPVLAGNAADGVDKTKGTTYFVSTLHGKEEGDGLTEKTAFSSLESINELTLQPGDKVLLEKGSVFENEYLKIKDSGTEDAVIEISTYGDGERPQINTNGNGQWTQDYGKRLDNPNHKYKGTISSSVLLFDAEYIEIRGLEITNDGADGNKAYNDLDVMNRTGVAGVAKDKGTLDHIVLQDLYVHDVIGNVYDKHLLNGGIYFVQELPENEKETGIPRYNDLVIEDCHVENTNRWGIAASYTAYWDQFQGGTIDAAKAQKYGSTNVVIRNNYLKDIGGDAITTMYCYKPLVEYNVSDGAAKQINSTDYSKTEFGKVAAGIWPWKCKDAVFQYNECFDTKGGDNGNNDAQAWDADSGDGTVYQYNYSHGNTGGAVMFCLGEAVNSTFRYNISQNDKKGLICLPSNPDAHVYNNTFYVEEGVSLIRPNMNNGNMNFENNIVYYTGNSPRNENWYGGNKKWDNNLFYNYGNYPSDAHAVKVNAGTQVMADPGNAPESSGGVHHIKADQNAESVFGGYQLTEDSPAVNAGKVITDKNGNGIEHDFFGKEITGVPDIGAAESNVMSLEMIQSTVFELKGRDLYVPSLEKNPMTVDELKEGVQISDSASLHVYDNGVEVTKGSVGEGMILSVKNQEGRSTDYTIHVKNDYQWALDYAGDQQGNVWFAQMRESDSEYSNFTQYDNRWPNWVVDTYFGVGIDEQSHDAVPNENTHGLIMDTTGSSRKQGVAMAFRVPKDGIVSFSIKDDEPYLRQSNNQNGSVEIRLTLNGQELQKCELTESNKKGDFPGQERMEVCKGDYIRIEARNKNNPTRGSVHITPEFIYLNESVVKEDVTQPSPVVDLKVKDITRSGAVLQWGAATDDTGIEKYEIYNGSEMIKEVPADTLEAVLTELKDDTEYILTVTAVDAAGNRSEAAEIRFKTEACIYNVKVSKNIEEAGTVAGETSVKAGEDILLTASAHDGYRFVEWRIGDQTAGKDLELKLTPESDVEVTAIFEKLPDPEPEIETGWIKDSLDRWKYIHEDGSYTLGNWEEIDGKWYFFDGYGYMITGWFFVGEKWYYLDDTGAMVTDWQQLGGVWYYFNASGVMVTGWQQLGGVWYYFDKNGAMMTDWIQLDGEWYYLNGDGSMAAGWMELGGVWYYFNGDGSMATGWMELGGIWYYFKEDGSMAVNQWIGSSYVDGTGAWV